MNTKENEKSALIAMSGGVDSSVAAYLMKKQGYRCMGATMRLYRNCDIGLGNYHSCCSQKDIDDAADVAFDLDIPYEVIDYTGDFGKYVIEKFIRVYEAGGTPNPCIDCNRYMKFEKMVDLAMGRGLSFVVTGHYARIVYDEERKRYRLLKALDLTKDQSYVLYMLSQEQLSKIRFPLGELTKKGVREIAESQGFVNSKKHDSQDICFVPDGDYVRFIEGRTGKKYSSGDFLDEEGNKIGTHRGCLRYTLGQRKGLGIAAGKPVYVYKKDMENNTVSVGEEALLFHRELVAKDMNWIAFDSLSGALRCRVKVRYRQKEQPTTVYPLEKGRVRIVFDEKQRAITPGQAVVLYEGDEVLGGGTIVSVSESEA